MSDTIKLCLTVSQYDECAGLLDKRVKKNKNIEVPRALFSKLVLDHQTMYSELMDRNIKIVERKA